MKFHEIKQSHAAILKLLPQNNAWNINGKKINGDSLDNKEMKVIN